MSCESKKVEDHCLRLWVTRIVNSINHLKTMAKDTVFKLSWFASNFWYQGNSSTLEDTPII